MPITLGTVTLEYKSLPIHLNEDGTGSITLRKGYMKDGAFFAISAETFYATKEEISAILDTTGNPALTRRNDLSLVLYQFCISKGAEVGVIS